MNTPTQRTRAILAQLQAGADSATHRLYAVVDCAQHSALFDQLVQSGAPMACLFADYEARQLQAAAPFLVDLAEPYALAGILGEGHGRAWCSYVRSTAGFSDLLEHLRRFVKCRLYDAQGRGQDAYFAFWDPRVAADWLPGLADDEARDVFAHGDAFFAEVADQPHLLARYRYDQGTVHVEPLALVNEGADA